MTQTKQIDWSYPTSTNAARFGFSREGCWTVSVSYDGKPPVALAGFSAEADAIGFAHRQLSLVPFGYLWKKYETTEVVD